MKGKPGRHAPAFVLLTIAKKPSYGLQILNDLRENMPHCQLDSAAIYRALSQLELTGSIIAINTDIENTNDSESGISKKYYKITEQGKNELSHFNEDILKRKANLDYFLSVFSHMEDFNND